MELSFFVKGLLCGLAIAAPVGPIGLLCIRRSLDQGMLAGFVSGLGAATADGFYGAVAGFGLTFISRVLTDMSALLQLTGGAFLCYLAFKTYRAALLPEDNSPPAVRLWGGYIVTLFLTLTNPATIISFIVVFAAGLGPIGANYQSAALLTLGVFLGSALWWLLLSAVVGLLRFRVTPRIKMLINKVAGVLLGAFGLFALIRAF